MTTHQQAIIQWLNNNRFLLNKISTHDFYYRYKEYFQDSDYPILLKDELAAFLDSQGIIRKNTIINSKTKWTYSYAA